MRDRNPPFISLVDLVRSQKSSLARPLPGVLNHGPRHMIDRSARLDWWYIICSLGAQSTQAEAMKPPCASPHGATPPSASG